MGERGGNVYIYGDMTREKEGMTGINILKHEL